MIFSMKAYLFGIGFCLCVLMSQFSLAQEYSSSSYERYVPLTDRAFDVKVDNLRNQVNSYEERLRRSRLRWNQLFQSQFELKKGGPAEQLNDALENSSSEDKPKASDSVVREKKFSNQMTSSLSNRYYLGFSVGALMAQPSKFSFLNDEIPIEFDTGIAGGLEIGRKFDQWSFSLSYAYSQASLSEEAWSAWLWTTSGLSIPVSKTGSLSFHSARVRGNYLLDINPWFALDLGLGAGYCFSSLSELPAPYPEQRANAFSYSVGIGARIAISDRGSLNLRWTYLGSLGGEDSFEPIDAYLAEVGASYYF